MAATTEVLTPLLPEELRKMDAYWRACNYLSAGMIYLRANPLLREPLKPEHIKNRLLGHWGSDPGQSLIWVHLNRLIKKYDLNVIFISGPGHGAPATLTGSSRGIGRVITLKLAERGAHVAVHYYQKEDEAKATLAKIRECGWDGFRGSVVWHLGVADFLSLRSLVDGPTFSPSLQASTSESSL